MKNQFLLFTLLITACFSQVTAQEAVNEDLNTIIRKHGLDQSKALEIAGWMTDVYGPRLTGSPMLDKATSWAEKELKDWGMKNVHLESWGPFGRGWEMSNFEMHANAPGYWPVIAYPKAWSPSVKGTGEVVYMDASTEEDLAKFKGKLKGKFILLDTIREVKEIWEPNAKRHDAESLLGLANAPVPTPRPRRNYNLNARSFRTALWKMMEDEQPLAILDRSYKGDHGTVFVSGARTAEGRSRDKDKAVVPQFTVAVEHYNRILRNLQRGVEVKLTVDLAATYTNPDEMEHNIIAEIPGTDLKDEVVMFGAHFDSWHTATGATDNGAGSTVMMEAARILLETIKESGVKPRRTLRLALWTGEEQGLLGSRGYAKDHFAEFAPGTYTPQSLKPEQEKISAYYNLDNGTGKVRGIYLQGNEAVAPIFRAWLQPFKDLDANTVSLGNTGGTDHLTFDAVGIPGFQFIQEPMAYFARTHHSNMDNFDHLSGDDLAQAATIIASFVMHTAMRDEMLPRKAHELAKPTASGGK
ncbi:M28 family peptidase [Neolewinella agarilytica]|uniref:Carboxypeptidase Q n=1 Tax=Neolewinella agarilytica TaxID=478744 RepID=A0A1H9HV21_9BACT|nr:M28 family peptidase [Neolewinella agarilytica]SEQ66191.1 Peptidase family M28 [Neolewinella agarilytica]